MRTVSFAVVAVALAGCGMPPPASPVPNARAALTRVHETQDCGQGIGATAKIDRFGKGGRIRGDLLIFAFWPALLRMDVVGPMNVGVVATLTADQKVFTLSDLREKKFYFGPAKACNLARLTTVPMPGHVLVSLLRGEAPVLKHDDAAATIEWSRHGYYVVKIPSTRNAEEEIHIAPHPADIALPWNKQRMRVVDVEVRQEGIVLYHAALDDHAPAKSAGPRVDPDGIDPPIPPSGPACQAELPRTIHVEVPNKDEDVQFRYEDKDLTWNPPLIENLFTQQPPAGLQIVRVTCED